MSEKFGHFNSDASVNETRSIQGPEQVSEISSWRRLSFRLVDECGAMHLYDV